MGLHFKKRGIRESFPHRQDDTRLFTQPRPKSALRIRNANVRFTGASLLHIKADARLTASQAATLLYEGLFDGYARDSPAGLIRLFALTHSELVEYTEIT